uniref:Putative mediator of RNA polymerase II transcription subunit 15a-like n=1 Tax=Davidia involucrata TaxID=16924 RepID=A0A5B6ZGQ6_DAVIN
MDTNNWRPAQGGEPVVDATNWRAQLLPDSRQIIVNKIMETLKRHLPFPGQEGLQELNKIAVKFEEKIFTAATSQSDYLRKISLKMIAMATKYQNPMGNSLMNSSANNSKNPTDPNNVDLNIFSNTRTANEKGDYYDAEEEREIRS